MLRASRWYQILASLLLPFQAGAERWACTSYSIADGLPHNHVTSILQDSRGFIWFGTAEGLARYDGEQFKTYDTRDGLAHRAVNFVFETRDHTLWVGTPSALCRFDPLRTAGRIFHCWAPAAGGKHRQVHTLFEDSAGNLFVGTEGGPYKLRTGSAGAPSQVEFEPLDLGMDPKESDRAIRCMVEHPKGVLWAAGGSGIYRRSPDGCTVRFTTREGLPQNVVNTLLHDRNGRIWAGFWDQGLALLVPEPQPGRPAVERILRHADPRFSNRVVSLFETSDGRILAGVGNALTEVALDPVRPILTTRRYTKANGLSSDLTSVLEEDREGNLWVASSDAGAMKIPRSAFVTFGSADGILNPDTSFLTEVPGEGLVIGRQDLLHQFDGLKFTPVVPNLPAEMRRDPTLFGWGWNQSILHDREGDWWIPTERGIFRFAKPARLGDLTTATVKAHYTTRHGLTSNGVFRLFEDSQGDVWISMMATDLQLVRWDRRRNRFIPQRVRGDVPEQNTGAPTAFREDRDGAVWTGFFNGGLARFRRGKWDYFGPSAGAPPTFVNDLLLDRGGRLWIAYNGGVKRLEDPRAATPQFVTYTKEHGLPSTGITSLAEDVYGRIYLGMHSRIARLDPRLPPEHARFKNYTAADGVPNGPVRVMMRDRAGAIWAAGVNGVTRLLPEPPRTGPPEAVRITGLKAGGTPRPISEFGKQHAAGYSFPNKGGSVEIEFVSMSYVPGLTHSYSYKLDGPGTGWSHPSPAASVTFAGLAPGRYRFVVKAVGHDSDAESEPAVLDFSIAAPIYRRGGFLSLLLLTATLGVFWIYRYRWKRDIALERMRMQIATDLHDELGAGLSQVAMVSEVALLSPQDDQRTQALKHIAKVSRELVGSAGDLVWAIRPKKDRVSDLSLRMREFAAETLSLLDIRFEFNTGPAALDLKLAPEQRRQVFAIFKESINNAVLHSGCTRVRVDLSREEGTLVMAISDDGKGLAAKADTEATGHHGIEGMKWRAHLIGGALELDSPSGNGLRVTLRVPLVTKGRGRRPA